MKTFFQELFEYNHHFNQALLAVLNKEPERVPEQCIRLISHMQNAHQVWNNRIKPEQTPVAIWGVHSLENFETLETNNLEQSLRILSSYDLNQMIPYTTTTGKSFDHSVRDILFQIINHSTYHRGQIATLFRENGLEPLLTDYIYYKMIQK